MSLGDGLRLAVGTFTVLPVPPPRTIDRGTARLAMLLAPLVGAALGGLGAGVLAAARWLTGGTGGGLLLAAAVTVAVLAVATRGMHLDGLADTADGLGVRRGREAALAAMREPGVGAFGVVTLVLVLLVQVLALAQAAAAGRGTGALMLALITGRAAAALACTAGVPAARPTGLGAAVAGSVPRALAPALAAVPVLLGAGWAAGSADVRIAQVLLSVALALAAGAELLRRCVARFGGVTGDVLGALVEVTGTVVLVGLAAVPGTSV